MTVTYRRAGIPGIPGGGEPSFRSGSRGWLSLDDVVHEVVAWLSSDGLDLSPYVVKATLQVTRRLVDQVDDVLPAELFSGVHAEVRQAGVLLRAEQVESVVRAYASTVALLDIQDVTELRL